MNDHYSFYQCLKVHLVSCNWCSKIRTVYGLIAVLIAAICIHEICVGSITLDQVKSEDLCLLMDYSQVADMGHPRIITNLKCIGLKKFYFDWSVSKAKNQDCKFIRLCYSRIRNQYYVLMDDQPNDWRFHLIDFKQRLQYQVCFANKFMNLHSHFQKYFKFHSKHVVFGVDLNDE